MSSTYPSPNVLSTPLITNTASVLVAQVNPQRAGLFVYNPSATITLFVSPIFQIVGTTPSVAVQPSQYIMFGPPNSPRWTAAMYAFASAGVLNTIVIHEYYP